MKKTKKQIALFLVLTFVLSWAFMFGVIMPAALRLGDDASVTERVMVTALMAAVMFFPLIGVILTRLLTKDWSDCKLMPHLKGNVGTYLLGWFGPLVLTIIGVALYYAIFPSRFTAEMIGKQWPAMLVMLIAPLINAVNSFGEEWGWRGFLFPKMRGRHSFVTSALLVGLIWGIWHAPIIAVGHNYGKVVGTAPWNEVALAIIGTIVVCIMLSFLFSYLTEKADSVWPAVLAHGCVNGCAGLGVMFLVGAIKADGTIDPFIVNPFIGPMPVGIVGGAAFIVVAVWIAIAAAKRKQPADVSTE